MIEAIKQAAKSGKPVTSIERTYIATSFLGEIAADLTTLVMRKRIDPDERATALEVLALLVLKATFEEGKK